jgi:hypothetical protein
MNLMSFEALVFVTSLVVLWVAARVGDALRKRVVPLQEKERSDFSIVLSAILTLLGLLIGFTFSMAISRYDQRKNDEAAEADAIRTAYMRLDYLPANDSAHVRELLRKYLELRISFYTTRDGQRLSKIKTDTVDLQNDLWSAVRAATSRNATPAFTLIVSGMNDVMKSQGYTQAAWWNRIPIAAWALMGIIAACSCLLIGYGAHQTDRRTLLIIPLAVAIAFLLIADIDAPTGGFISVAPQDLLSLLETLHSQ